MLVCHEDQSCPWVDLVPTGGSFFLCFFGGGNFFWNIWEEEKRIRSSHCQDSNHQQLPFLWPELRERNPCFATIGFWFGEVDPKMNQLRSLKKCWASPTEFFLAGWRQANKSFKRTWWWRNIHETYRCFFWTVSNMIFILGINLQYFCWEKALMGLLWQTVNFCQLTIEDQWGVVCHAMKV